MRDLLFNTYIYIYSWWVVWLVGLLVINWFGDWSALPGLQPRFEDKTCLEFESFVPSMMLQFSLKGPTIAWSVGWLVRLIGWLLGMVGPGSLTVCLFIGWCISWV